MGPGNGSIRHSVSGCAYGWAAIPSPARAASRVQSVKTTGVGGERGYDGGKQVKGRKRHLLVDTEGLVLRATVHPANIMDRDGVKLLLLPADTVRTQFPRLRQVWLDAGYNGKGKGRDWIEQTLGWRAEIVAHRPYYTKVWMPIEMPPEQRAWFHNRPPRTFRVLPRRWVVEGTQPHYLQDALDVQECATHYWAHRAA
jgi:putative transposase